MNLILPTNWNDLFACWKDYYYGSLLQKPDLTRAWVSLPKELFEGKASNPRKVMLAAKLLWVEALAKRGMNNIVNEPLNYEERTWAIDFLQPVTNS